MSDWKQFFEFHKEMPIECLNGAACVIVEDMYQAFKSRLLEETTACQIPEGK